MGWRVMGNKLTDYSKSNLMDWVEATVLAAQKNLFLLEKPPPLAVVMLCGLCLNFLSNVNQ